MECQARNVKNAYFAAANGYTGFRSYFNNTFKPEKFARLFILKGGPGTGKSTLMRDAHKKFENQLKECELIYCSSDPSSLDGVIMESEKGRVGIIDGTAPHMTDPKYPGCIDEIINLGEFWNSITLSDSRSEIEKLSREKNEAYERAYSFLSLAGKCSLEIDAVVSKAFSNKAATVKNDQTKNCGKLIDSFGKDGIFELNTLPEQVEKIIGVVGIWGCEQIYLNDIISMYSSDDVNVYPSAFSDSKIKAVYIKSENIAYVSNPNEQMKVAQTIDVTDLININTIKEHTPYLEKLRATYEAVLWHSTDEFKKASRTHFLLEDIYKSAMDFSKLNEAKYMLYEKIDNILF